MVMLLPLSEQLLRLRLSIHACTYISVYLSLYQNTAYHCQQGLKNTIIELLKTSTDLQISKGVGALKELFLKKKGYSSPLLSPLPKTHVC